MTDLDFVQHWADRARHAQQAVNELVAPTDGGDLAADEGTQALGRRPEPGDAARVPNSPSAGEGSGGAAATASPDPYTSGEFDALVSTVWSLDVDDPTRFDELLTSALAYIGRVAIDGPRDFEQSRAAGLLRRMEQRALWGPDQPVGQS